MVILDTSIIIDHLRRPPRESYLFKLTEKKLPKKSLALSIISVQELYEGQSTKDLRREEVMLSTINTMKILPYTFEVAQLAGKITRDLERPIEIADAAIAATVIINGGRLATLNRKDLA